MIDHVSIGVRDFAKAQKFYDAVMKPLGYDRVCQSARNWAPGSECKRDPFWRVELDARRRCAEPLA